jgi:hypothetical protein
MNELISYVRSNWLAIIALVISVVSVAITWTKNVIDRRYTTDKELLEQLKQSLALAYQAVEGHNSEIPTNNRMGWLSSARHIIRYRQLQLSLKTTLYRTICEEQEEYWRDRFYNLLRSIDNSDFYESINPDEMVQENIEPRSAAIVHSFSVWKKSKPDPLDDMSFEEIVRRYKLFSPLQQHFMEYVKRKYPSLAEKVRDQLP